MSAFPSGPRVFPLALVLTCLPVLLWGQDLRREIPEPAMPTLPDLKPAAGAEPPEHVPYAGAFKGEAVILNRLAGLRFVTSESAVSRDLPGETDVWLSSDLEYLDIPEFRESLDAFLGQPVSIESMRRIERTVSMFLAASSRPFSVVYPPEQDVTAGVVTFVIQASTVSQVDVQDNRLYSDESYLQWLRQSTGTAVDAPRIREDMAWINRHPYRSVQPLIRAGDEPATSRFILMAREARRAWSAFAGFNNGGTVSTDEQRVSLGVTWANAFERADIWSLTLAADPDVDHFRAVSTNYTTYLPWRHILTISANYSTTDGIVAPPFSLEGESWQVTTRYEVPLPPAMEGKLDHTLTGGLAFKASDNNFAFAATPITDNLTHVIQARLGWQGSWDHGARAGTNAAVSVVASPGGLTSRNDDTFFDISRPGASDSYLYLTADASHRQVVFDPLVWTGRLGFQASTRRLIGSEQFGAGGSSSVRGYDEGAVYADNGILLSQQVTLYDGPLLARTGNLPLQDNLSLSAFQDFAYTWNTNERPNEREAHLHSVGVAADYRLGRYLSARVAYGWQLAESIDPDDARAHIALRARW